jgi:methionyl aminopeptidase
MMYKIPIKTEDEIYAMRKGGAVLGIMLRELKKMVQPGLDVWSLEERFLDMCQEENTIPACKNYTMAGFPPFPTGLCISLNDQAVHCFPVKGNLLQEGDLLTIDTVIQYQGMYLDSAVSFGVGKLSENKQKLLNSTQEALDKAIEAVKPGVRIGKLSYTIQRTVEKEGFSVLRQYAGHGIGLQMHEPPEIPCYGQPNDGPLLKEGMMLAIEPLVCENGYVLEHENFWETRTLDGGNFVQVEHTVLVTKTGSDILTN